MLGVALAEHSSEHARDRARRACSEVRAALANELGAKLGEQKIITHVRARHKRHIYLINRIQKDFSCNNIIILDTVQVIFV